MVKGEESEFEVVVAAIAVVSALEEANLVVIPRAAIIESFNRTP